MFTGMKSVGENHLWGRILICRDEISIVEGLRVQSHTMTEIRNPPF